jgi:catechol 2,3-dioxygenase-like lactoylglutathione lyase family enzyme
MIGYGDEDTNFVLELTVNYGLKKYRLGNDFRYLRVDSPEVHAHVAASGYADKEKRADGSYLVRAPGGYAFAVYPSTPGPQGPLTELAISCSDLDRSLAYWVDTLGLQLVAREGGEAVLRPAGAAGEGQCRLRLVQLPPGEAIDRGEAYGRVAFSVPGATLRDSEALIKERGYTIHTPYVSLPTPGKADVQVVILQDPDGTEICLVGDEGFRNLSRTDPRAADLLREAIEADTSDEYFADKDRRLAEYAAKKAAGEV